MMQPTWLSRSVEDRRVEPLDKPVEVRLGLVKLMATFSKGIRCSAKRIVPVINNSLRSPCVCTATDNLETPVVVQVADCRGPGEVLEDILVHGGTAQLLAGITYYDELSALTIHNFEL